MIHGFRNTQLAILTALVTSGCARSPAGDPDLIDIARVDASIQSDIRYAGHDNFVGVPIDGYGVPRCWLTHAAAKALSWVQQDLHSEGLGLRVYDCYRPQRAVDHFVRWAGDLDDQGSKERYYPSVAKSRLLEEGYIAERSGHSRGSTVDLTLAELADGEPLDLGSRFDFFDPRSHTESPDVSREQRSYRMRLRAVMERHGFENFPKEWWHYTLRDEPFPTRYRNVPIR